MLISQRKLQQFLRWLGVQGLVNGDSVDQHWLSYSYGQKLSFALTGERWIQAERTVGAERETRALKGQPAGCYSIVQGAKRPVRIEWQHDDLGLEEAYRWREAKLDWSCARRDRCELVP